MNTRTYSDRMKTDYCNKLQMDIPGENWDATIITCYGNGIDNSQRHAQSTRLSCYARNGEGLPTLRTCLCEEIRQGNMIWIPEQATHYLLLKHPQKSPQAYSTPATPCNKEITFYRLNRYPNMDRYGYKTNDVPPQEDVVRDMPCVVRHSLDI